MDRENHAYGEVHGRLTVLYDACVLYPDALRNVLIRLGRTGMFRARWTETIHEEWMTALSRNRPDIPRNSIERIRSKMNAAIPDCLVTGFEDLIEGIEIPDPNDRHVVAAALRCRAATIVTRNLKDFPSHALEPLGLDVHHPDRFVTDLLDQDQELVCEALREMRASLKFPPYDIAGFLGLLERSGLVESVERLRHLSRGAL